MTAPSHTVDSLVGEVSFALTNFYDPGEDLDKAIRFALHTSMMRMVDESGHASFRMDGTITTIADQATYDLADDFQQMIDESVKFTTSPYRTLTFRPEYLHNALERDRDQASGYPEYYFVRSRSSTTGLWQIQLWPTPDDVWEIAYRYRAVPQSIHDTAPGSAAVIDRRFPVQFVPHLVSGAISKFPKYITPNDFQARTLEYENAIIAMKKNAVPVAGAHFKRAMFTGNRPLGSLAWRGNPLTGPSE